MATTGRWLMWCAALLGVLLVLVMVASTPADAAEPGVVVARVLDDSQWEVLVWGIGFVVALLAVHVVGSWRK
jgi:hypothetical protein